MKLEERTAIALEKLVKLKIIELSGSGIMVAEEDLIKQKNTKGVKR